MNYRPIVADTWMVFNEQFFVSNATIQEATEAQNSDGQIIRTWADIETLKMLPCAVQAIGAMSIEIQEDRQADITSTRRTWHVTIQGHYGNQINDTQRVQIFKLRDDDAEHLMALNIIGVENDSHSMMTRLRCEVLSYDGKSERS